RGGGRSIAALLEMLHLYSLSKGARKFRRLPALLGPLPSALGQKERMQQNATSGALSPHSIVAAMLEWLKNDFALPAYTDRSRNARFRPLADMPASSACFRK